MQNQLFRVISARTTWLTERHGLLAQNLANSDTPKFVAKDLKELDLKGLQRLAGTKTSTFALTRTHANHLSGIAGPALDALRGRESEAFEIAPGGNSVVIEEQASKLADTQLDYQLMTNVYRKHVEMVRVALGRGG